VEFFGWAPPQVDGQAEGQGAEPSLTAEPDQARVESFA